MILSHFSDENFRFNTRKKYPTPPKFEHKPKGLWLSDETELGWSKWTSDQNFRTNTMAERTTFDCNLDNWAVLNDREMIDIFTKRFTARHEFGEMHLDFMNWAEIMDRFSGILITPYCWGSRTKHSWYYGWDCASGCVWDLSTIKLIKTEKTNEVVQSCPELESSSSDG